MQKKLPLFLGIILLSTGILLRVIGHTHLVHLAFIIPGSLSKIYYISMKVRRGEYVPGKEFIALWVGLALFFSALYMRSHNPAIPYQWFMFSGIALKVLFVSLFIVKSKKTTQTLRAENHH